MIHSVQFRIREKPIFTFWGKVTTGKKRGKLLGYPTANIALHKNIPEGIYAAKVTTHHVSLQGAKSDAAIPSKIPDRHASHAKTTYISATFIGAAKTFGEKEKKAESFLLEFSQNLYGKWITVRLYKKLRGNSTFNSEKELIIQIMQDVKETREFFA